MLKNYWHLWKLPMTWMLSECTKGTTFVTYTLQNLLFYRCWFIYDYTETFQGCLFSIKGTFQFHFLRCTHLLQKLLDISSFTTHSFFLQSSNLKTLRGKIPQVNNLYVFKNSILLWSAGNTSLSLVSCYLGHQPCLRAVSLHCTSSLASSYQPVARLV